MSLTSGTRLGPYEIVAAVGAGGMGEVYRAKDTRLQRTVAIKVLPDHLSDQENLRKRFEQEARAVSALNHPNICTLHDIGSQDRVHYLVMEFLSGETLRERLRSGKLSQRKATDFGVQIAKALGAAHEEGVVHRDLKPENIFITKEERVKILDFGLAHYSEEAPGGDVSITPTRSRITDAGTVMGTVGYMSPEHVRGIHVDEKSDIFSLGVILFEMLAGKRPFERETSAETMTAILREDPPDITTFNSDLSPVLISIVHRCLEKKPELRFHTAHDLAFALQVSTSAGESTQTSSKPAAPQTKRRAFHWIPVALLLPVVLAAGFWVGRKTTPQSVPAFRAQTFRRGFVHSASFAPDGVTLIYGAAMEPGPLQLYAGRTNSIESSKMGLPPGDVLGISKNGTMAVLLNRHYLGSWVNIGTLAKVPVGGAPREILENVHDADIADNGDDFAVVRTAGAQQQLEFPIGKVIVKTDGWITSPRISADTKRIAFIDHHITSDDRGFVAIVEDGKVRRITEEFQSLTGLCWSRDEKSVWFSGARTGEDAAIWEAREGKPVRLVLRSPTTLRLLDIDAAGRVLLTGADRRAEIGGKMAGDDTERDFSWYGDEDICGITADATALAATQTSEGSGLDYQVYFRRLDGSSTVQLGPGNCEGFSPDGKWVIASIPSASQSMLVVYPTGPGEVKKISLGDIRFTGARTMGWSFDGNRVGILGTGKDNQRLAYVLNVTQGKLTPVTTSETLASALAPDGNSMFAITADGRKMIYPVSGGAPKPVPGLRHDDWPIQWDVSGAALFVSDRSFPAKVYRVDLHTGARELWKEISPSDPLGVLYGRVLITPDGQHYIYRFRRILNRLYLAEGLS